MIGLKSTRARLTGGVAILALSAGSAMAQQGVEQIVVSSTRLQAAGFDAPTPTTVVSAADLDAQAKPSVFEALTQMPALQGSTGVQYNTGATSNGLIGLSALNLRGLSALRTLTLMDGQRVVGSNYNGVVDISEMPQLLIQRVDLVTGGASASWGSDAVAGVVNFVTDKEFEGFKMNAQAGLSTYGDMGTVTYQMAAGTSFASGRGHFEASAEYSYNDGLLPRYPTNLNYGAQPENLEGRRLWRQSGTVNFGGNGTAPAGLPDTLYVQLPQNPTGNNYGAVASGAKVGTAFDVQGKPYKFALAGNCYVAPKGSTLAGASSPLSQNTIAGAIGGTCVGTPSNPGDQTQHGFTTGLVMPLTRGSLYSRVSYKLTPDTEIYATLLYGAERNQNTPAQGTNGKSLSIKCDNPYLLGTGLYPSTAACLTDYPSGIAINSGGESLAVNQNLFFLRTTRRYVVGAEGKFDLFGKDWTWDSYFQHGESDAGLHIYNMLLVQSPVDPVATAANGGKVVQNASLNRWNMASDAVVDAGGNVVCRNTVAQSFGCVPFNPFGQTFNPAAQAYILNQNQSGGTTIGNSAVQTVRQEVFSFNVHGSPIEGWAGPIAVAAGYEYREEHYSQRGDPYAAGVSASTPATVNEPCTDPAIDCGFSSLGSLGSYSAGNYHNARGTYHVNEVYLLFGVPLLNDQFWGKMDLEIGGRHARYSTAGDANTWKVGLNWDTPIPGVRLRALQSRDVRAPNLSELFAPVTGVNACISNDVTKTKTYNGNQNCLQINEGNRLLKPERSQTTSIGLVWQPEFIPGFQMSVDYFRVAVQGVISSLSPQQVEDLCILFNNQSYCGQDSITTANGVNQSLTNPGGPDEAHQGTQVPNQITAVHAKPFNAASLITDGVDIEATYQFDLQDYDVPGQFTLRSLASHVSKFILDPGNILGAQRNIELAGNMGGGSSGQTYTQSGGTVMTWKLQETQSYQNDIWGFNLTERWYADGVSTNKNTLMCGVATTGVACPVGTFQTPTTSYNKVSAVLYLDVGFNWNVSEKTNLYAKVDNVTNLAPPDTQSQTVANSVYDVIGRMYRVGVRVNY